MRAFSFTRPGDALGDVERDLRIREISAFPQDSHPCTKLCLLARIILRARPNSTFLSRHKARIQRHRPFLSSAAALTNRQLNNNIGNGKSANFEYFNGSILNYPGLNYPLDAKNKSDNGNQGAI